MSDVFILGAGFSKAASLYLPVELQMPLLTELASDVEARLKLNNSICELFPNDLELWLSFWLDNHPWLTDAENSSNRETGLFALGCIRNKLFLAESLMAEDGCSPWLTKLIRYWLSSHSSVISLNYDSLVERCAAGCTAGCGVRCGCLYPVPLISLRPEIIGGTGSDTSAFVLYKLHGSDSWFHAETEASVGNPIYYFPYASWEDKVSGSEELVKGKTPFIVPPRFNKAMYFQNEIMSEIWAKAREALASAQRIFVLGYSLPPSDLEMRYFLAVNARRNEQEVFVFDTNPEVINRFSAVFGNSRIHLNAYGDGADGPIPPLVDALQVISTNGNLT